MTNLVVIASCFFAIIAALVYSLYLLFRENERLGNELKYQVGDPLSPRHQKIYQDIIEQAEWGVATRSADGSRVEFANPKFSQMHGYSPTEVVGMHVNQFLSEYNPSDKRAYLKQIGSNGNYRFETVHRRKDGSTFPALVDSIIIRDGGGNALYRTISVLDITEQKRQASQLARSELTLGYIAKSVPAGIWFANKDGTIEYGNPAAEKIWGGKKYVPLHEIGTYRTWDDEGNLIKQEESALFKAIMQGEPTIDQLVHIETFDGQHKTILNTVVPLLRDDNVLNGALIINQDVTTLRKSNEALAQSQSKLRELVGYHDKVREDECRRIAREVHDELGQHMTALRLDLGIIRMNYGETSSELVNDLQHMNSLIDESIQVVRNIASDLRPKALDMGFQTATRWHVSNLRNRTSLDITLDLDDEGIDLDDVTSTSLFRIVQESLTNIMRHANAKNVRISLKKVQSKIHLKIQDDGVGFDPEFAQSKQTFGLLGMKERSIILGGECSLESEPGKGATINVSVPVINLSDQSSQHASDPGS